MDDWKNFLDQNGPYDNILLLSVIHNDMKVIGVEEGLRKLETLRGKAGRVFLEGPYHVWGEASGKHGFTGKPPFDFSAEESAKRLESAVGSKVVEKWSSKPGSRPIYTFEDGVVASEEKLVLANANSYKMYLFKDEPIITPWIKKTHVWEPMLTQYIKENLKEGQTFVDIGANVGYYSLLASRLVGDKGKVYAFEPAPDVYQVLLKNIELNKCSNVVAINKAVSSKEGQARLYSYGVKHDKGQRGLTKVEDMDEAWQARHSWLRKGSWLSIETTRLSSAVLSPPDFIKVDVEGGERDALEGMRDILKQGKSVLVVEDVDDKDVGWVEQEFGLGFEKCVKETNTDLKYYVYKRDSLPFWDLSVWLPDYRNQYWPLFNTLRYRPCRNIMEIGTHNGNNAVAMIKAAAQRVPEDEIHYYGFDLFEEKTGVIQQLEFAPVAAVNMKDVMAHIRKHTKADVTLVKGNTRKTIRMAVKTLPQMDLIYIDGGHSIETTRNDWQYASKLVGKETVVYFDDYNDEMPFIGSYFITGELEPEYHAEVLPTTNYYKRPFGRLKNQLLRVTVKKPAAKLKTEHFRLHLMSLPHSKTVKNWGPCAFTMLAYRFCQMMMDSGHDVFHYGAEGSNPACTEHIDVLTDAVQKQAYGNWSPWKQLWIHNGKDLAYTTFRKNAIEEFNRRKEPGDILLISNGNWLREVSDKAGGGVATVEPFVGYLGSYAEYKVFPSYAWMHHMYGKLSRQPNTENFVTGNWYDAVIPHFFDPKDYTYEEKKEDYLLYTGRLIQRKGIHIAVDLCNRLGMKLKVAGQPLYPEPKEKFEWSLKHVGISGPNVEYLGVLDEIELDKVRCKAKALIAPSLYMEPFGLIIPEALFSGTPVITTDWGAFPEIVKHGEVGYRCRTMDDFMWAVNNIDKISPAACREYAVNNYSMERISKAYQEYFVKVHDLFGKGWYTEHKDREDLDWLRRY